METDEAEKSRLERKLTRIVVAKTDKKYLLELHYGNKYTSMSMPRQMSRLESYICGVITGSNLDDLPVENYPKKNEHLRPLRKAEFEHLLNYINAWSTSGLDGD